MSVTTRFHTLYTYLYNMHEKQISHPDYAEYVQNLFSTPAIIGCDCFRVA